MSAILLMLAAAPAAATVPEAEGRPSIVVTAQLREQAPFNVPMAVSVVGGDALRDFGLAELEDVARFVPGLAIQNQSPNDAGFVMRGITSDSGAAFEEPRVSVFQDGLSIARSRGAYVEPFDLARIEASKGPQTTLYGRGALIGAINIVSNRADPERFAAMASGTIGNYEARIAEAMVNAPLGEGVALRVAGRIRKRDGYVPNLLGGADDNSDDTRAGRAGLRVERGALTLDLIGNVQRDTPSGTSFKSIAYRPTDPATGAVIGDAGRNSGAALAPAAGFEGGAPLGVDRHLWSAMAIATVEMSDAIDLVSLSGYRRFDAKEIFDVDGTSLPLITGAEDARGRQISQELRLRYAGGPLTGFIGASWFHETGRQRTAAQFDERMAIAQLTGALNGAGLIPGRPASDPAPAGLFGNSGFTGALVSGVAGSAGVALSPAQAQAIAANLRPDYVETSSNMSRTNAFDIFGDATLKLSERFEVGAGLRWSHDDKRTRYAASVLNGRSVLGGLLAALTLPAPARTALLGALAQPGAGVIPPSAAFPVPLFGLALQPTTNNGATESAHLGDDGFSWRMTARFVASEVLSLYANYARGRRPRLLAVSAPAAPGGPAQFERLPNERVDSVELGAKAVLADRRLFLDGALYRYAYANFQTVIQQATQFITVNAGRARSYGFEGQMRWHAGANVDAFASYSYNHSRFASGVRKGNRFRLAPDHAASAGMIVGVPLGEGRIELVPSVSWQSKMYFDDDNDRADLQQLANGALVADTIRDEVQSGYALANMRIGYRFAGGLAIEGFVTNVFDRRTVKDAGNSGDDLGLPTFVAGEPRFYGMRATYSF